MYELRSWNCTLAREERLSGSAISCVSMSFSNLKKVCYDESNVMGYAAFALLLQHTLSTCWSGLCLYSCTHTTVELHRLSAPEIEIADCRVQATVVGDFDRRYGLTGLHRRIALWARDAGFDESRDFQSVT